MPCARCGEWALHYCWLTERRQNGPSSDWRYWERDAGDPECYWIVVCLPGCRSNQGLALIGDAELSLRDVPDSVLRDDFEYYFRDLHEVLGLALEDLANIRREQLAILGQLENT